MNKLSVNKYFKSLKVLFASLLFSQVIFILVALHIRTGGYVIPESGNIEFLKFIVPLFAGGGIYQGNALFKRRLKKARQKSTMADKLADYRTLLMVRYALWEAPSLFAVVAYLLSGVWIYLAISGLIVMVFLANTPTMKRVEEDLGL